MGILPESTQFLCFKIGKTKKNSTEVTHDEAQIMGLWVHDESMRQEIYETLQQCIALERHICYFNATGVLPPSLIYGNGVANNRDIQSNSDINGKYSISEESNNASNSNVNEDATPLGNSKLH